MTGQRLAARRCSTYHASLVGRPFTGIKANQGYLAHDMDQPLSAAATLPVHPVAALRRVWGVYMELAKARLSALVVTTAAVGYLMASGGQIQWLGLIWLVIGTALAAGSANGLNQVFEAERDALMPRTRFRPLPSGRMGVMHAAGVSLAAGGVGVTILAAMVNLLTAALALATILIYLFIYTPLKVRSTLNTLAGSVVGAIPPMMGWVAVTNRLDTGAWVLAALLLVWQVPHFLALAWMYRRDYALGGYRMLPMIDPTGLITARAVIVWSLALVPVAVTATLVGLAGWVYAIASVALGAWLIRLGVQLYRRRSDTEARRLFLASVVYLPLLMGLMVIDRRPNESPLTAQTHRTPVIQQPASMPQSSVAANSSTRP